VRRILASAVLILAIGGCSQRAEERRPKIRVAVGRYISSAPLYFAIDRGYFTREGIDVELIDMGGTQSAMAAIAGGDVDVYGGTIFVGSFNAMLRGQPVQIVADKGHASDQCSDYALMIRNEAFPRGAELTKADLVGKRVAARPSSIDEYAIDTVFEKMGIDRDEVQNLNVPGHAVVETFIAGQIDLRFCGEPTLTHLQHSNAASVWRSLQEITPGMQAAVLVYGPRLLERERDLGHAFMRAYLDGVRDYNQGKTPENVAIVTRFTRLDEELISKVCWPAIREDGEIDTASIDHFLAWARKAGYLDGTIEASRYWNPDFVRAAR
jgi:NitT/TauT family transport system substrate-binding protein